MSALAAEQDELKSLLRGLLISSPITMTADQLLRDFRKQEGQNVPFLKFGYTSFLEYLQSIPDVVAIRPSFGGSNPIVVPVQSKKSSHVDALVKKQKINPPKGFSRVRPPPRRLSVKAPPESSRNCSNRNNDMKQRIIVPHSLQQRIYKMVHENPKGVPVQTIEREHCSVQTLQNYGIQGGDSGGVYQLLNQLDNLKVSTGMVYSLQDCKPIYTPVLGQSVGDYQKPNISTSETYRYLPAGSEQNGVVEEDDDEQEWEISHEEDADIAKDANGYISSAERTKEVSLKCMLESDINVTATSRSPLLKTSPSNYVVSEQMKKNFQMLLDRHPGGIWCSELPHLYKDEFRVVLEYVSLGFVSVIQMVSNLPDVFHCVRPDGTDWKVFDARKQLPPQYSPYDIKSNKIVSTSMVPSVPSRVRNNIERLLMQHPKGLPSDQFLLQYKERFLTPFSIQEMGFDTMESFLLSLNDTVLHLRYVNQKILVYPHARDTELGSDNPLPHITEPQDLFSELYLPEVVGPKGKLSYQKIPPETAPGGFLEVLVAEVYTPQNFWVQLRGEKTHLALDKLMNEIQDFYNQEAENYHMPGGTVRIGQYCMAPYNEEWHRACVTAVHNLVDVQVLFVDYGTSSKIKMSELRFMHLDYATFPIQAIKASLANLMPTNGAKRWPRAVSERFLELVSDKNLVAVISSIDHERYEAKNGRLYYRKALVAVIQQADFQERKLEIALVDTSGKEDVHINDVLAREGLAEYKSSRPQKPTPPPKRVDEEPLPPTVTVSRPPPGFTAGSQVQSQSFPSPTESPAPASTTSTEIPRESYPQAALPNMSMPNINPSYLIPQSSNVPSFVNPLASSMYDSSLLTNVNPFLAQPSLLQQLTMYEQFLQQQQLLRSLVMANPTLALLVSPHVASAAAAAAAAFTPQYGMPMLNPAMMYNPTPISDRTTNIGRSEVDILEVSPRSLGNSPLNTSLSQVSPVSDQSPVTTKPSTTDLTVTPATSGTVTSTKESPSVISPNVEHLPITSKIDPAMYIDIPHCSQPLLDSPEPQKEVTTVNQVTDKQKQNEYVQMRNDPNNTVSTQLSFSTDPCDFVQEGLQGVDSDPEITIESEYVNEAEVQEVNSSPDSDDIYRSDDEEEEEEEEEPPEQEQNCVLEPHYVKKIEIARRMVHLVNLANTAYLCTDEVVRLFTDFSGRHVVLKILDAKGIQLPFREIRRTDKPNIFQALEFSDVIAVPKSSSGYIMGNIHLTPLHSIHHLLTVLHVQDRDVFRGMQEEILKFDPKDTYWTGNSNASG